MGAWWDDQREESKSGSTVASPSRAPTRKQTPDRSFLETTTPPWDPPEVVRAGVSLGAFDEDAADGVEELLRLRRARGRREFT